LHTSALPRFVPLPLACLHAPFDHPDWLYELKLDTFRALAYVERGGARLVSRNGNGLRSFPVLTDAIAGTLARVEAVLDGEIVHLGPDGTPQFYDLMRRRTPQHLYAFDLLWLDGRDLRPLPLLERKRLLRAQVPPHPSPLLYVDHIEAHGVRSFEAACQRDLEGIVAKLASGRYTSEQPTWVKIKNRSYSQAEGPGGNGPM